MSGEAVIGWVGEIENSGLGSPVVAWHFFGEGWKKVSKSWMMQNRCKN